MRLLMLFLLLAVSIITNAQRNIILLHKNWEFAEENSTDFKPATVPGCVHTDLLENGLIKDPFFGTNENNLRWIENKNWVYRTTFDVDSNVYNKQNIELIFNGLDTYAEVYLNEHLLFSANNMFRTWTKEVKHFLTPTDNILRIVFTSPMNKHKSTWENKSYELPTGNDASERRVSVYSRKAPYHFGWDWAPRLLTSGIWQSVELKGWNSARLNNVWIKQDTLVGREGRMTADFDIEVNKSGNYELNILREGRRSFRVFLELDSGQHHFSFPFVIYGAQRWWPNGYGRPNLYFISVELREKDRVVDLYNQQVGLRTIELVQEEDSIGKSFYFKINGEPIFMKGANYIPGDVFLNRVTPQDYQQLIRDAKSSGMNMLRVWGGGIYERDLFYTLCDRNGILVWQDFMFACSMYPEDEEFMDNVAKEVEENIKRLRKHACIALWCGNNEMDVAWHNWGWQKTYELSKNDSAEIWENYLKIFHELIPNQVAQHDDRAYITTSPLSNWGKAENFNYNNMHYWGVWHGEEKFEEFRNNVPRFMSEYGFQSFPEFNTLKTFAANKDLNLGSEVMKNHQKSYKGSGMIERYTEEYYGASENFEEFVYKQQLTQALGMGIAIESHRLAKPHCMGTLYWQLNDCWPGPSWSGIDYEGKWKALQYKVKELYQQHILVVEEDKGKVKVSVVSDVLKDQSATLKLRLLDFNGKEIWREEKTVDIPANSVLECFNQDLGKFIKRTKTFLVAELKTEKKKLLTKYFYFCKPKELKLKSPKIELSLEAEDSAYRITLKSNTLAKNVWISSEKTRGNTTDNYFDLLPGEEKVIYMLVGDEPLEKKDFSVKMLNPK